MEGGCFSKWALDKATPLWRKHTGWGEGERQRHYQVVQQSRQNNNRKGTARSDCPLSPPGCSRAGRGDAGSGLSLEPEFRRGPAPSCPEDNGNLQRGVSAKGSVCFPSSAFFPACHAPGWNAAGWEVAVTCQRIWKCSLHIPVPLPSPVGENKRP